MNIIPGQNYIAFCLISVLVEAVLIRISLYPGAACTR